MALALPISSSLILLVSRLILVVVGAVPVPGAVPEAVPPPSHRRRRHKALVISLVVAAFFLLCLMICFLSLRYKRKRERKKRERKMDIIFSQRNPALSIGTDRVEGEARKYSKRELEAATDTFTADNIIGSGKISTVYKGGDTSKLRAFYNGVASFSYMRSEEPIAVKILNIEKSTRVEQFLKSYINVLSRIRHRNLVQVEGGSEAGEQLVALVTKFVGNGNLETVIYAGLVEPLDLTRRLNIMITTSQTLVYLHNICDSPIVHCHLRPTNILLDEGYEVLVSDYGTAPILWFHLQQEIRALSQGTISYIAPEIGVIDEGEVSSKADVYSVGIILMEIITRRRPSVALVSEGAERVNLREWVEVGMKGESIVGLVDSALAENMSERQREKIINMLKLSLLCTKEIAEERPTMNQVLSCLVNIKQDRMDSNFCF